MLILPAIDLLDGQCVRLRHGRSDAATVYSDNPVAVARSFVDQGAEGLHLADLEGARLGRGKNLEWIYRIREAVSVPIQVGGGIRTFALATRLCKAGIDRVVVGTAAAEDLGFLAKLLKRFDPDRVAASIELRHGRLAIQGRESESNRALEQVLVNLESLGVRWLVCTDVARDGTLAGSGYALARRMTGEGFRVIVAGGVATIGDIRMIREIGAAGCIIGSALYEGALSLPQALEAARAH